MNEIDGFTRQFTKDKVSDVIQLKRNFFKFNEDLMKLKDKIGREPFAIGTFLGSGKPFHPSSALLDWLGDRTNNFVVVDKRAEWLFLCGRDVFVQSILEKNADSGLVLVKNQLGEVLGYGEMTKNKKVPLKNKMDKGDFLRRER
ncbi:hypothetical protein JXB27_02670 [Candidatus Woesearchaeota archaeon]|nr:hypothetical protein [Candidatus Woesearchaeota archaeon]